MEAKLKYLEFIQNIITRMADNSFKLKGWTVAIATAACAFAANNPRFSHLILIIVPIIAFHWLDSYYLQQERLYRDLYTKAETMSEKEIDFSLKATRKDFPDESNDYFRVLSSKTEVGFYAPILFAFLIAFSIMLLTKNG